MRTKDEIEHSLAEMERLADDALRGIAKAKEMKSAWLEKNFQLWHAKCEARAQILKWVLCFENENGGKNDASNGGKPM